MRPGWRLVLPTGLVLALAGCVNRPLSPPVGARCVVQLKGEALAAAPRPQGSHRASNVKGADESMQVLGLPVFSMNVSGQIANGAGSAVSGSLKAVDERWVVLAPAAASEPGSPTLWIPKDSVLYLSVESAPARK